MKMNNYKYANFLLKCVALTLCLSACEESEPLLRVVKESDVRFINTVPDANVSALDVKIDGETKVSLRYSDVSSYVKTFIGQRYIGIYPQGSSNLALEQIVSFAFDERTKTSERVSVFLADTAANISMIPIRQKTIDTGFATLRFLNLSPDMPSVDLTRNAGDTNGLYNHFVSSENSVQNEAIKLSEGNYNFEMRRALHITQVEMINTGRGYLRKPNFLFDFSATTSPRIEMVYDEANRRVSSFIVRDSGSGIASASITFGKQFANGNTSPIARIDSGVTRTIKVESVEGLYPGQYIQYGAERQNEFIESISPSDSTITLSSPLKQTRTSVTASFGLGGTTTNNSNILTLISARNRYDSILVGQTVVGGGIREGTTVTAVSGNQITLSQPAFSTTSTSVYRFFPTEAVAAVRIAARARGNVLGTLRNVSLRKGGVQTLYIRGFVRGNGAPLNPSFDQQLLED
jgi:hypothetical protein